MHELWETKKWSEASTEEVKAALLDSPPILDPDDMAQIYQLHPQATEEYLKGFYGEDIPAHIKAVYRLN